MVNPTYKHLEAKTRLGLFSLSQWAQLLGAGVVALTFGIYVSPLPPEPTIFLAILIAGAPLALSYGTMGFEFSIAEVARAAVRHWRSPARYFPGAGSDTPGYLVHSAAPVDAVASPPMAERPAGGELEAVWDW